MKIETMTEREMFACDMPHKGELPMARHTFRTMFYSVSLCSGCMKELRRAANKVEADNE